MEMVKNMALIIFNAYKANLVLNTVIVAVILVTAFIALKIKKVRLSLFAEMVKVQLTALTGEEKFEKVVNWFLASDINKKSILKYIPEKYKRNFIQWVFGAYKDFIKAK